MTLKGFFAYPSYPDQLGETIQAAINEAKQYHAVEDLIDWRELDIPGRFIATEVVRSIDSSDFLLADITTLNFNVTYEIGYAIGRGKRVLIVRNAAYAKAEDERIRRLGIFDSLGYKDYENSRGLAAFIRSMRDVAPHPLSSHQSKSSPIYVTKTRYRSDYAIRLLARLKRLDFRLEVLTLRNSLGFPLWRQCNKYRHHLAFSYTSCQRWLMRLGRTI